MIIRDAIARVPRGSSDKPAVPGVVRRPRIARLSGLVEVAVAGLSFAAEVSTLCCPEQPTSRPLQSRPSTQRPTLP